MFGKDDGGNYLKTFRNGYDLSSWAQKKGYSLKPGKNLSIVGQARFRTPTMYGQGGYYTNRFIYGSVTPPKQKDTAPPGSTTPPTTEPPPTYNPTPLDIQEPPSTAPDLAPSTATPVEPTAYSPGGASLMIGGNATTLRRKKSTARMSGAVSRGTSQFKIGSFQSGLNIGV